MKWRTLSRTHTTTLRDIDMSIHKIIHIHSSVHIRALIYQIVRYGIRILPWIMEILDAHLRTKFKTRKISYESIWIYCWVNPIHERINFCIDTSLFAVSWAETCDSPKITSFHSVEFQPIIAWFKSVRALFTNKWATRVTLTGITMLFACFSVRVSSAECSFWKNNYF